MLRRHSADGIPMPVRPTVDARSGSADRDVGRSSSPHRRSARSVLLGAVTALFVLAFTSSALAATYTSTITIPVPPASQYAGSGGGDGWSVAFSTTDVFNVFHHQGTLSFACHEQADASPCYSPETITDANGHNFGTSAHPGMYFDSGSEKLYVYATRDDGTGGVVCIDTTQAPTNTDPFCGFTALTAVGDASFPGMSAISNPELIGSHWYAFNYYDGDQQTGSQNTLLCFDVSTDQACSGQPYSVIGTGHTDDDGYFPSPVISNIDGKLIIPVYLDSTQYLECFDDSTHSDCGGSFPVTDNTYSPDTYGGPFPRLDSSGNVTGFCLPDGTDECYDLTGASIATPANMPSVIDASTGWNGPAVVKGSRVYVPNGNQNDVECFDYSMSDGGNSCTNFPFAPQNLSYLYTVNVDPQRPACLWVNADGGADQIQNFDAFSGQPGCGSGAIRVLANQFVVDQSACYPASYDSLQVNQPPPSQYTSGSVAFEDGDGNPISGVNPVNLDNTGTADLHGLALNSGAGLPQFLVALNGVSGSIGQVTMTLTYEDSYNPACTGGGQTVQPESTSVSTSLAGGTQSGSSITVAPGTAVTDQVSLSGANAGGASGTVTYSVYSDASCTQLVGTADDESITRPGVIPASQAVTLDPGTYYWMASYSGDQGNDSSASRCGDEVETVSPGGQKTSTSTSTSLSGGGRHGTAITIDQGTAVTDHASVSGSNAAGATGTVTYSVYSDASCTQQVGTADTESITTPGAIPASAPVTLSTPGPYYWVASYSGDGQNLPSASRCGDEVETVSPVSPPPTACSMVNRGLPRFNGVLISNQVHSNLKRNQTLTLRKVGQPARHFGLTAVGAVLCRDNPKYPLAPGHAYNTVVVQGTGLYNPGTAGSMMPGYGVTVRIRISSKTTAKVSFTIQAPNGHKTVWRRSGTTVPRTGREIETENS
jgi:hypothetical protein